MSVLVISCVSVVSPAVLATGVEAAPNPGPARIRLPPGDIDPDGPEVIRPSPDEATVVRDPEFVRGAARSGDSLIAASRGRTCAVRPNGRVTCWGEDGVRERPSAVRGCAS